MTKFYSDNVSSVCPEIFDAMLAVNQGDARAYGRDDVTRAMTRRFSEIFECDLAVYLATTGTIANALSLSAITPSFGAVYCHRLAHVNTDECGAPELFTGGAKLIPIDHEGAKLTAQGLNEHIFGRGVEHHARPSGLTLTQATELGTLYQPHELEALCRLAKDKGLKIHMDGARFANAVSALEVTPAAMTWQPGIDVLTFGGTKNGCLMAEAIVFFDLDLAADFAYRHKRAGQLLSKTRFISAQFEAYLQDELWLHNAEHANRMASRLSNGFCQIPDIELAWPTEANEIFVHLPDHVETGLVESGHTVNRTILDPSAARFVTAWNTREEDIDALLACCLRLSEQHLAVTQA